MGTVQKIARLAETGSLTITGDPEWYIVTYKDSEEGIEIRSECPKLEQCISSIDTQIKAYWTRVNMSNLWKLNV